MATDDTTINKFPKRINPGGIVLAPNAAVPERVIYAHAGKECELCTLVMKGSKPPSAPIETLVRQVNDLHSWLSRNEQDIQNAKRQMATLTENRDRMLSEVAELHEGIKTLNNGKKS